MVSDVLTGGGADGPARDRAQLILIGAIAVALLVIGIAVVLNAVLYTENVRPNETTTQLDEATEIDREARHAARSLILRVNHQGKQRTPDELGVETRENVTRLGQLLGESYVNSRPLQVNVNYQNDSSDFGTRFVMEGDYSFDIPAIGASDQTTWDAIDAGSNPTQVGWALLNVNTTETADEKFHVNFTSDSDHLDFTFNKTGRQTFNVTTETSGGTTGPVSCEAQGDRALLDLVHGQSYTHDDCVFNGTAELGPIETVTFDEADNAWGKYSFVTNDSAAYTNDDGCDSNPTTQSPCQTPAVWTANVSTSMFGDSFTYDNRYNVSIYEVTD